MSISDKLIEATIISSGAEFDSHDIIHKFAHHNQRLYVSELYATDGDRPFQVLHSTLGRQIKGICERLGFSGIPSRSLDIFGQHSECVRWTK